MNTEYVIALGFFDGVHVGHAALLRRTLEISAGSGLTPAVITFDRAPMNVVTGQNVPLITSPDDRADIIRRLFGIETVIFLHFNRETMEMPWEDFIDWLSDDFGGKHFVAGHDFRCGYKGAGTAEALRGRCAKRGIGFDIIEPVELSGIRCSSTIIREKLLAGDIDEANRFLGHPHVMTGTVRMGKHLARTMNTPTINMYFEDSVLAPRYGVYATKVYLPDGSVKAGVTNVGVRPTVNAGLPVTAETFILGYSGNLYGQRVRLEFFSFIRPEVHFGSLDELRSQIQQDAKTASNVIGSV